jgi:D-alanyl-D-alanine carboxypeptidase
VSSAADGNRQIICVVLGERERDHLWADSYRLFNWGFYQMKNAPRGEN